MKTNAMLLTGMLIFSSQFVNSQIIEDNLNIETTVFDESVDMSRYDYYPNLQAYFDKNTQLFIFKMDGVWVRNINMPSSYRGYGLRNGFHILIENYSGEEPYLLLATHKLKYPADFSTKRQRVITTEIKK